MCGRQSNADIIGHKPDSRQTVSNALEFMPTAMYYRNKTIRYFGGTIGMETGKETFPLIHIRSYRFYLKCETISVCRGD
jgi:hypothetical protein